MVNTAKLLEQPKVNSEDIGSDLTSLELKHFVYGI